MNKDQLQHGGEVVLRLALKYGRTDGEARVGRILLGYLEGRFGNMSKEWHTRVPGYSRPARIDFRHGGTNPVVIELAVRRQGRPRQALMEAVNETELRKLTRVPQSKARLRA